jgi:hypothetical protein
MPTAGLTDVRLSDREPRFVCAACGKRGAEVRPDFNWNRSTVPATGYPEYDKALSPRTCRLARRLLADLNKKIGTH